MSEQVEVRFTDDVVRKFVLITIFWGVVGMLVGLWIALELAFRQLNLDTSWLTFGRLRPLHTNAVVFAFAANAIFAGVYHSSQRLLKTPIFSVKLANVHFWLWQLIIVLDALCLVLGVTQGKEYAEPEWIVDILITVAWVMFSVNLFGMIFKRREKHMYVSIWFYIATVITIAVLHLVNNMVIPVDWLHSVPVFAGVQDALTQWWYGHNAVGFLLTTPFLGMMYYYLPKVVNKPVFSYRLSIIHFWSLVFIYIWAGPHHLLYTSLPEWAQTLGMVFSLMLLMPSWGGMVNGLFTLRYGFDRLRDEPILKFLLVAITFYGMSTFEGPMMAIKSINALSHYTDWTIGHVHSGALGWVGFMIIAMLYYLVPKLWKTKLYSWRLANIHFWLGTLGIVIYVVAMWVAGITQGLMWAAFDADGVLQYPNFLETLVRILPMYYFRAFGGFLYLSGMLVMVYNFWRTIAASEGVAVEGVMVPVMEEETVDEQGHRWIEVRPVTMSIILVGLISVGSLFELMPTYLIKANVPKIEAVKPYTALELMGRSIYISEGCYNCHSQMVRPFRHETERYGEYSKAGEFVYDHPFQWGSRRIGPDLHRVGKKYPDLWHWQHMRDPQSTSEGSIMPGYPWLYNEKVDLVYVGKLMKTMSQVGVPYSVVQINNAAESYTQQAQKIAGGLRSSGAGEVLANSKVIALIAYLQRLGTDIRWRQNARQAAAR